jgi:hypothetical protein
MPEPDNETLNNQLREGLAVESAPSLSDLATPEEGAGAWPKGWYRADIVEGYTTGRGNAFETRDQLARDSGSRNLFLCLVVNGDVYVPSDSDPSKRKLVKGPGGVRNIRETFNYRPRDLSPERIAAVKRARDAYSKVQGAWPDKDIQAASLSLGRLGQLEKAVGFKLPFIGDRYDVRPFIKQTIDVRLVISDKGFSEVAAVAKAGTHVK